MRKEEQRCWPVALFRWLAPFYLNAAKILFSLCQFPINSIRNVNIILKNCRTNLKVLSFLKIYDKKSDI